MDAIWQSSTRIRQWVRDHAAWVAPACVVVALIGLTLVGLPLAYQRLASSDRVSVLGQRQVTELQLAKMAGALTESEIGGFEIRDGQLLVAAKDRLAVLAKLNQAQALPADFHSHTELAVKERRLFESERDSLRRIEHARERDLAATIERMPGIRDAMVQYGETVSNDFLKQTTLTASVTVETFPDHQLTAQQVRTIQSAVAGARGMRPQDVFVSDVAKGLCYADDDPRLESLAAAEHYLSIKRMLEREWQDKLSRLLQFVPGVEVVVNLELPARWRSAAAGVDDAVRGTPNRETAARAIRVPEVAPRPERIAIAVQVPQRDRLPVSDTSAVAIDNITGPPAHGAASGDPETEDLEPRIRAAISTLMADYPEIESSLQVITFQPTQPTTRQVDTGPIWPGIWRDHQVAWSVMLVCGAVVAILPTLRRRLWRQPSDAPTIPIDVASNSQATRTPQLDAQEVNAWDQDEESLRGTLTELVREDPDGAAELLHRWLDRAG